MEEENIGMTQVTFAIGSEDDDINCIDLLSQVMQRYGGRNRDATVRWFAQRYAGLHSFTYD